MLEDESERRKLRSATGDIVCWPPVLLTLHPKAIMKGKERVGGWEGAGDGDMRRGRGRGRGRWGEGGERDTFRDMKHELSGP